MSISSSMRRIYSYLLSRTMVKRKASSSSKTNSVDGINYRNAEFVKYHNEFKKNPRIKSFHLPQVNDGQKRGKFGSFKCEINNIVFDSVMEARYYVYLLDEKAFGNIKDFEMQKTYSLLPSIKDKAGKTHRATTYIADFVIHDKNNNEIVIDIKGKKTEVFKIKEKMLLYFYPDIDFRCIQWDSVSKSWNTMEEIAKEKRKRKRAKTKSTTK